MPRVTKFQELPDWLRRKLSPTTSIRDPEYRVHRIGDTGWWALDAGTGGVVLSRQITGERMVSGVVDISWDDLEADESRGKMMSFEEGDRLRTAVRAEFDPRTGQIEALWTIMNQRGVDPRTIGRISGEMKKDKLNQEQTIKHLVGMLYDGLMYGNWPK